MTKINRGREKRKSIWIKKGLGQAMRQEGCITFFELGFADVIGVKRVGDVRFCIAGESQTSVKHLCENIQRDVYKLGCDQVWVGVPDGRIKEAVERKINRELEPELRARTSVLVIN
jgi:hypothetical protein